MLLCFLPLPVGLLILIPASRGLKHNVGSSRARLSETTGNRQEGGLRYYDNVGYHSYAKRRYCDVPYEHTRQYCEMRLRGEKNTDIKKPTGRCSRDLKA
jgi:hypothetical protein